jgi:hypothetical protein
VNCWVRRSYGWINICQSSPYGSNGNIFGGGYPVGPSTGNQIPR